MPVFVNAMQNQMDAEQVRKNHILGFNQPVNTQQFFQTSGLPPARQPSWAGMAVVLGRKAQ